MARSEEEDRIPLRSTAISVSNVRIDHDLRSSWIMGMCRRLHTLLESERVYYDEAGDGGIEIGFSTGDEVLMTNGHLSRSNF